jgi:hypothetical protein
VRKSKGRLAAPVCTGVFCGYDATARRVLDYLRAQGPVSVDRRGLVALARELGIRPHCLDSTIDVLVLCRHAVRVDDAEVLRLETVGACS